MKSLESILTRTSRSLIKEAVDQAKSLDPNIICDKFSEIVTEKYKGEDALEYQLTRMGLETTKKVIFAINVYLGRYGNDHIALRG